MFEPTSFFWAAFIFMVFLLGLFAGWLILAFTQCSVSIKSTASPAERKVIDDIKAIEAHEGSEPNFSGKSKGV